MKVNIKKVYIKINLLTCINFFLKVRVKIKMTTKYKYLFKNREYRVTITVIALTGI